MAEDEYKGLSAECNVAYECYNLLDNILGHGGSIS